MSACETEGVAPVPESRQGTEYHKEGIIEAITGLEEYLADNNLSLPPQVKAYLVVELLEEVYKVPAEQRSAKIIQFIPPYLKGLRAISA
ncbi:hypothetical protein FACS1894186_5760 [Alphaproteobacteria bacterium]|nr:hypothetical protein FACS1894186_5760 [Alphaproteobacteria bacterium]